MSTRSTELRAAIRAYLASRGDAGCDVKYAAHIDKFSTVCARYGRRRVLRCYRRYRGSLAVVTKDDITYWRV